MNHELDQLIQQLATLGLAYVSNGPQHPTDPLPELQEEIDDYLADYPALHRYPDYVDFLETYAAASVGPPAEEHGMIAILPGFQHGGSIHLNDMEWEWAKVLVQEQGFFLFATVSVPGHEPPASYGAIDVNFLFEVTGKRKPGVYAYIKNEPIVWFCDSFLIWLRRLIDTRGHLYGYLPYVVEPLNTGGRYELADELPRLMERFALLGNAVVGQGPQHPTSPRRELQSEINRFLAKYPMLRRDPDYMAFLETYAGATIESSDTGLLAGIYGFQPYSSMHVVKSEGPVVDKHGFLCFALVQVPGEGPLAPYGFVNMSFSFDATGKRAPGVYRAVIQAPSVWFCNSFLIWLRLLIETRGHLYGDLPGSP